VHRLKCLKELIFNRSKQLFQIVVNHAFYGVSSFNCKRTCPKDLKQLDLWDNERNSAGRIIGGMKRRLMISRCIMHEPRMLNTVDDLGSAVDIEVRRSMWTFLKKSRGGYWPLFWLTHYLKKPKCYVEYRIIRQGQLLKTPVWKATSDLKTVETYVRSCTGAEPNNIEGFENASNMTKR